MKISIIVPVYNVSEYIVECLDSVAAQRCEDCECIIVDDCGTDDSMEKVSHWLENYSGKIPFRVLHHECNKGLSAARNTGTKDAKGDYVLFIDSDDYLLDGAIESFEAALRQYPEADVVMGCFDCEDEGQRRSWNVRPHYPDYITDRRSIEANLIASPIVWNKLMRLSLLRERGLKFSTEVAMAEDLLFTYSLAKNAQSVAYVRNVMYYYRYRETSLSRCAERSISRIRDMVKVLSSIQRGEVSNRYNAIRFHVLREMRFLITGRRPYTLTGAWHEFDRFAFSFFLSELVHLRLKNLVILTAFLPPMSKLIAHK